jgi:hypothetical protein
LATSSSPTSGVLYFSRDPYLGVLRFAIDTILSPSGFCAAFRVSPVGWRINAAGADGPPQAAGLGQRESRARRNIGGANRSQPCRGSHPPVDGAICNCARCDHVFCSASCSVGSSLATTCPIHWPQRVHGSRWVKASKLVLENRTLRVSPGSPVPGSF